MKRRIKSALIALFVFLFSLPAFSQLDTILADKPGNDAPMVEDVKDGGTPEPGAQPVDLSQLFELADTAESKVRNLASETALEPPPSGSPFPDLEERILRSRDRIEGQAAFNALSLAELDAALDEWRSRLNTVDGRSRELGSKIDRIGQGLAALEDMAAEWKATLADYHSQDYPQSAIDRAGQIIDAIGQARQKLQSGIEPLLSLQVELSQQRKKIQDHIDFIKRKKSVVAGGLWEKESPSFFELGLSGLFAVERIATSEFPGRWASYYADTIEYLKEIRLRLIGGLLTLLAVYLWLRTVLGRLRRRTEDIPHIEEMRELFGLPFSIALLLVGLPASLIAPGAPLPAREVYLLILLIPVLVIFIRIIHEPGLHLFVIGMGVAYGLGLARDLLIGLSPLDRVMLAIQSAFGIFITWEGLSVRRLSKEDSPSHRLRRLKTFRLVLLALLSFTLAAEVMGFSRGALIAQTGIFDAIALSLLAFASFRLLRSFVVYFLYTDYARRVASLRHHAGRVIELFTRLLFWATVLLWLYALLSIWGLWAEVSNWLSAAWSAGFKLGDNKITVGVMAASVLAIYLSIKISRLITFLLDEEFYPRRGTEKGLREALNQGLRYIFIFAGFVIALSFLGVRLQNLAIIAGALGVGIGFGLQNVVNNFVSGIILLVERPVKVGDAIQFEETWGYVRSIGIRATLIETWDRSELILPNGDLLWSKLVNWTYTNKINRVIVSVGVSYASDPKKVIEILNKVADQHPNVLKNPVPIVLFVGFGESSLDFELRVYLPSVDLRLLTGSELRVAIFDEFKNAGIQIPFPQRDLWVKSWPKDGSQQ